MNRAYPKHPGLVACKEPDSKRHDPYAQRAECQHQNTRVEDLTVDRMCGNVVCADCGKFLRTYDAG